jgi:hypothetical protein
MVIVVRQREGILSEVRYSWLWAEGPGSAT